MREDYNYVREACDVVLCTTRKGARVSEEADFESAEGGTCSPTEDLLFALERDYFVLKSPHEGGIRFWYAEYMREYREMYDAETPTSQEEFIKAITDGLVSIRLVIWDESIEITPRG